MLTPDANPEERKKTACFSGHRPEKLPDGGNRRSQVIKALKSMLYKTIVDSIDEGYTCFMTGLARGVDLWAGEMVLELKAHGEKIKLIAVAPYKGHGKGFVKEDKFTLGNILLKADEVIFVSDKYDPRCMQRRNEYMVDHSGKLIAVISDYRSGTGATIRYAQKSGIETKIISANQFGDLPF